MSRSRSYVSLLIVSSDAPGVREFRIPRFLYRILLGVCCAGLVSLIVLVSSSQYLTRLWLTHNSEDPMETQLAEANQKTRQLAQELEEMKQIARSIRHLAGAGDVEPSTGSSGPESGVSMEGFQVSGFSSGVSENEVAQTLSESRLPFLLRAWWKPIEEADSRERQKTLFRSTPSIWPVRGWVTREFQNGSDLIGRQHPGMDIAAREGTPVLAAGDGIVTFADWDRDLGWLVVIEHGYGFSTRYGHNSSLRVEQGKRIQRGQIVALVGSTGNSTAPHLHYEVWKDQQPVDPRGYLQDVIQWNDLLSFRG
jgi:murein DD-endopeptidase MepM/ murein hydrolase activator NlpD